MLQIKCFKMIPYQKYKIQKLIFIYFMIFEFMKFYIFVIISNQMTIIKVTKLVLKYIFVNNSLNEQL
jgi:hypothetical protein